jgi:exodeoxyribonuclease V alpha subunit
MKLQGVVEDFIYQNDSNSYTIAVFTVDFDNSDLEINNFETEQITIVGYLPFVAPGDSLLINGSIVHHKDYGEQFKIDSFEKIMPKTKQALEKYLGSGIIKKVGPVTAKKIVEKFGDDTLAVFKFEPERLAEIKGITKARALEIGEEFNEKWGLWQIVGFLEKFGIGSQNAQVVYDALGPEATKKIEKDPYILIDIVYGVDFRKIDDYALAFGIAKDSNSRIKSGIKYALLIASYNGNTCVQEESLIIYTMSLLNVDRSRIEENLINLNVAKEITIEDRKDEVLVDDDSGEVVPNKWVYLYPICKAENNIAERLTKLQNFKNIKEIKGFKVELKKAEKKLDIKLSDMQKEALEQVNDNNVCIITGGPGTGKTTIIKCLIDIYEGKGKKVVLCAPTGRAAKRMTETTGHDAKTIHRLLEIGKIDDDRLKSVDIDISPVDADIMVIDEMSMVDVFVMNYIVKALYYGTKLVLVGDSNQLPSVGPGNVLKDLIESEKIPFISLNKIFRQAELSKIIVNAHRVNSGETFIGYKDYDEESLQDFYYVNDYNQDKIQKLVVSLCKERLKNYGDYDFFKDIQVLTPTKKGKLGTKELNKLLQQELNPKTEVLNEKQYGLVTFREGDKVMQIKNNYDIYWERQLGASTGKTASINSKTTIDKSIIDPRNIETSTGIFNGELGRVTLIDNEAHQLEVEFDDGKTAMYAFSELEELEHSYSITIHKAQGSEFDVVILVVPQTSNMLLTRNLLYTGMTRAKKLLIVIGNNNLINNMIQNSESKKRNTGLKTKLKNYK